MTRNRGVNMLQDYFRYRESRRSLRRIDRDSRARSERRKKLDGEVRRLGFVLVKRDVYLRLQRELHELRDFKLKTEMKEAIHLVARQTGRVVVLGDEDGHPWAVNWSRLGGPDIKD